MTLRYRKWGRSVRREGDRRIEVDEAGEAVEDRGRFRAASLDERRELPPPDAAAVDSTARTIESMVVEPLLLERMIVSEGIVEHQIRKTIWRETSRRVHLSIASPPLRALIDLADFDAEPIPPLVDALRRAGKERSAPPRLRLAQHIGAALLGSLDVAVIQSAAPHDGNGQPIEQRPVTPGTPPNWYRPTYRIPPRRSWFHLRVAPFGDLDDRAPVAVALLAPVHRRSVRVLCVDGDAVYPAMIQLGRVAAARPTSVWYPYGAGAFGAEILLECGGTALQNG